jgi:ABC-type bacteriocin/lantibiotic exporter with double-glycine peptidase domain
MQWLRENMVVVEQQSILFPGTIADNISITKPGATLSEIQEAAMLVCILYRTMFIILTMPRLMQMSSFNHSPKDTIR